MDDYLTSDVKSGVVTASQSKRTLKVGSKVRVRITAVSLGHGISMGKIGVTCRQPTWARWSGSTRTWRRPASRPRQRPGRLSSDIR